MYLYLLEYLKTQCHIFKSGQKNDNLIMCNSVLREPKITLRQEPECSSSNHYGRKHIEVYYQYCTSWNFCIVVLFSRIQRESKPSRKLSTSIYVYL